MHDPVIRQITNRAARCGKIPGTSLGVPITFVNGWLETGELVQERTPNPNRQKGGDIVVIRVGKPADIAPDKAAGDC